MINSFYKPKNEYGELLISEIDARSIITNVENSLIDKINEADILLNKKIENTEDTLNEHIAEETQRIDKDIAAVDSKHSIWVEEIVPATGTDIHEYFRVEMENRWAEALQSSDTLKEFAWKLGRTIYILKNAPISCECTSYDCNCNDTFEEYICINSDKITSEEKPKFTRLGAVDSILATRKDPGSSILIGKIYDTEEWEAFGTEASPISGRAIAPIALKSFVEADKQIISNLEDFRVETSDEFDDVRFRLKAIENDLGGSIQEGEIADSRIDRIEKIIGINGCCDANDKECDIHCDDCETDCNIFCRINDINIRLDENDKNDQELSAALDEMNNNLTSIEEHLTQEDEKINSRIDSEVETINDSINSLVETHSNDVSDINSRIQNTNDSLSAAHARIDSLVNDHNVLVESNMAAHNELQKNISDNKASADSKFYELDKIDAQHTNEIGRIEDKIDREISDRITLAAQYSDLNNRINDIHTDCVSIRSDINAHEISAASTHTKFSTDIAKNAENLEIAKVQNAGEHSVFSTKIENAERKISEIQNIVTSHNESAQNEINSLRMRTTTLETGVSNLNASVNEIEINAESLSNRMAEIRTALDSNIEKADDNSKDITNIENRLSIAESSIASNNVERIKDINDIADSLTAEIAARAAADTDNQAVCKQYTDNLVSELENVINSKLTEKVSKEIFESNVSDINKEIEDIKSDIDNHANVASVSFSSLNSRIDSLNTLQEKVQADILTTNAQVINNSADINTSKQNIATNTQSISTINTEIETCKDNIISLQTADETIKNDIVNIKGDVNEINSSLETLNNLIEIRQGNVNIFAKTTLINGHSVISKEKILNRIAAGEESFWTITVNSVQEKVNANYELIYPEINYTADAIEIIFGDASAPAKEILISFTGINTTTNDIITL